MKIIIAGGTGLVGQRLVPILENAGHKVILLTRKPKKDFHHFWNPDEGEIDLTGLKTADVLINLSGAGIADKRWTDSRKRVLYDSRIGSTQFLYSIHTHLPQLRHFISASGINAYGYEHPEKIYSETDAYGNDYLSQLVKQWEDAADLFNGTCLVAKLRFAVVLEHGNGALSRMLPAIKAGIGSPIGSGDQMVPWIHADDLARLIAFVIEHHLSGTYNAIANYNSNRELMQQIAVQLNKPFWFPNVPEFMMNLLFGEMADMLTKGVMASNEKIKNAGFQFNYNELEPALRDVLKV